MDTATSPPSERSGTTAISGALDPAVWNLGVDTLRRALNENDGCISSLALRQMLDGKGVADAREVVVQLKFYDFATPPDDGRMSPDFRWHTHAKSFYSDERYARFKQQQEAEVARAASNEVITPQALGTNGDEPEPTPVSERRKIRQEDLRFRTFVRLDGHPSDGLRTGRSQVRLRDAQGAADRVRERGHARAAVVRSDEHTLADHDRERVLTTRMCGGHHTASCETFVAEVTLRFAGSGRLAATLNLIGHE